MTGEKRHPLPAGDEGRGDELPEHLRAEKGEGDGGLSADRSGKRLVAPDGEPYAVPSR